MRSESWAIGTNLRQKSRSQGKRMPQLKCIYCLQDVAPEGFNTEHVISRAFGTFENNLTLTDMVCCTCNQFFGDNLERAFARDSFEAYDRIHRGVIPPSAIEVWPQDRLTFTAALTGEWSGLRLRLVASGDGLTVEPLPQVGLPRRDNAGWVYLTEPELADSDRELPREYDRHGQIRIIAPSAKVQDRLIDLLAQRGIQFRAEGEFAPPNAETGEIEVYVNTRIDPIIKRCIAKMVFNYLARVTDREFVLLPAFDSVRAYIRHGASPGYLLVDADDTPILADDRRTLRQTDGHLVTVNWTPDNRHVVGQLSLFNRARYRVNLARGFSGLWRPIRSGHHFDIDTRRISPLAVTSLYVPGAHPG
jgi:hypothetical protein